MASSSRVFNEEFLHSQKAKARTVFLAALGLLCLCAVATYLSFSYFNESAAWVAHSQEVRAVVGDLESSLNNASRARLAYLISGEDAALAEYQKAASQISEPMRQLRELTKDNPVQVDNCAQLDSATTARLQAWHVSVEAKQAGKPVDWSRLIRQNIEFSSRSAPLTAAIRSEENRLLSHRTSVARRGFLLASLVVISSFLVALFLLYLYFRLLTAELRASEKTEMAAAEAYRREAALHHEADRFRLFIETVNDYAIFTLDSDGRVTSWNKGAERLKGYAPSEIIGKHFSCFFPEDDARKGEPQRQLEAAARQGRYECENWRVRKDGSRFWANIVLTAIRDDRGKLVGFAKVTRDSTERMRAQEALQSANIKLAAEVAERKSAEKRLAISEKSLRELSLHLLSTQDEERRRIGRELHDSLGQYLAMLKMNLDSLESSLGPQQANGVGQELRQCIRLAEDSLKEVRTISYLLYPPMLEEMGLKSAIPWYLDGFSKRSAIATNFEIETGFGRLAPEVELALFRVLQESLTNVHRHSGSSTASVRLSLADGAAVLQIQDRGNGIPTKLMEESGQDWLGSLGVGLRGMSERMRQLGGKLEVASTATGTTVTASLPGTRAVAV
jgi:PAS domain S-box-containing protein